MYMQVRGIPKEYIYLQLLNTTVGTTLAQLRSLPVALHPRVQGITRKLCYLNAIDIVGLHINKGCMLLSCTISYLCRCMYMYVKIIGMAA